ncbi:MAG: hypothetical protein BalsKO_09550 [Balneolaceae bacterium]
MRNYFLKSFYFFIPFLAFCEYSNAQETRQLSVGATFFYSKDIIISESIYSGKTTSFNYEESFSSTKILKASYLFGNLHSRNDNKWHVFSPKFSFLFFSKNIFVRSISNQFGIGINSEGLWIDSSFNSDGDERSGRKSGFLSFYPSFEYKGNTKLFKNYELDLFISAPIFFYTLRPGYATLDPDKTIGNGSTAFNVAGSGKFQTVLNQPKFITGLSIHRDISETVSLLISYKYHLQKISFPKNYSSIDQTLNFAIRWEK